MPPQIFLQQTGFRKTYEYISFIQCGLKPLCPHLNYSPPYLSLIKTLGEQVESQTLLLRPKWCFPRSLQPLLPFPTLPSPGLLQFLLDSDLKYYRKKRGGRLLFCQAALHKQLTRCCQQHNQPRERWERSSRWHGALRGFPKLSCQHVGFQEIMAWDNECFVLHQLWVFCFFGLVLLFFSLKKKHGNAVLRKKITFWLLSLATLYLAKVIDF